VRNGHRFLLVLLPLVLLCLQANACLAQSAAVGRLAVLDFQDRSSGAVMPQEVLYLSDLVRGAARRTLPAERFLLMTRENIQELLPEGRSLADCVGDCAVETGRKIGADYVVTGDVTSFGGQVRVTANLHEIGSGNLLGQVVAGAPNVLGVEDDLKAKVLDLLAPLRGGAGSVGGGDLTEGKIGGGATVWSAAGVAKIVASFASDPPGAMVEVDGQPVGETPCGKALAAGVYRVGIKKVHYVAYEQAIEVNAGVAPKLSVVLTPDFGWLTVESDPAGLAVTIDAEAAGSTPLTAREVSPGPHEVMITAENYHDEGQRVVIDRGERETVRVAPVPRNGGITVIATDPKGSAVEATVKSDGRVVGNAYEPITLLRGRHEVTVETAASTWRGEVMVVEEKMTEVPVGLAAKSELSPQAQGSLKMVTIPAGSFTMGSPSSEPGRDDDEQQHPVEITQGFSLSATEVTQAQYQVVMGANPSNFKGADLPVERVSWLDAVRFCNTLSEREGLKPAYRISGSNVTWDAAAPGYRLPTEAEWEYACRAGTTTARDTGGGEADLGRAAWYNANSGNKTHPVGKKAANAWGLCDMHGNVWEWCWDLYGDYNAGSQRDPKGATGGSSRVNRGASWADDAGPCRSAYRLRSAPSGANDNLGFRVARSSIR
jgi:formylglycine-generating enzyme required for sulfatase activity